MWSAEPLGVRELWPVLERVERALGVLGGRLTDYQRSDFRELHQRMGDRHDGAAVQRGRLLGEALENEGT